MKIFLSTRERVAGLFIVATVLLVAAFFVGAAVRNRWLTDKVTYHTRIVRGDGLRSGAPIVVSGVEVGEIGQLTIEADDQIDVELVITAQHANRVRVGTTAVVRRLLGIGEKRIQLTTPTGAIKPLAPGGRLPVSEPLDLLDVMSSLDLGALTATTGRALGAVEKLLATLEEKDRLERLVATLDKVGPVLERLPPTLDRVDKLLDAVHGPAVSLLNDPALHGALVGLDNLMADPATRKALHSAAAALEPKRIDRLVNRADALLDRLETLAGDKGPVLPVLQHADKLLTDGRIDRLIGSMERLTDEKKLARLLDNLSMLAEQTGKIGPEIPHIVHELTLTLREAVVVLKAVQKTWMLEGKSDDARKELQRDRDKDKPAPEKP